MHSQTSAPTGLSLQYKSSQGMPWDATKKQPSLLCEDPAPLSQIHRRGYKVSPVQDADLSAQPFSVKLRLRIPALLTFPALLSAGQKPPNFPATHSKEWSSPCSSTVWGEVPAPHSKWDNSLSFPHATQLSSYLGLCTLPFRVQRVLQSHCWVQLSTLSHFFESNITVQLCQESEPGVNLSDRGCHQ